MDWLLGFLLVLYAPMAGLLLAVRAVQLQAWRTASRVWWFLWLPFAALAILQLCLLRLQEAADLAAFAFVGFFAGLVVSPRQLRGLLKGAVSALPILLLAAGIDAYSPYATWQSTRDGATVNNIPFSWLPLQQHIDAEQSSTVLVRQVASVERAKVPRLSLRGSQGNAYYLNHPGTVISETGSTQRFDFGSNDFLSAYKPYRLLSDSTVAPVRISASLRMMTAAVPVKGCRGLSLRTYNAYGDAQTNCQPSEVRTTWTNLSRIWTPPDGWQQDFVFAGLFDFGNHSVELQNLQVAQFIDEEWVPLPEIEGLMVRLDYGINQFTPSWFEVPDEWVEFQFKLPDNPPPSLRLSVPLGSELRLSTSFSWGELGLLPAKRARAWFDHPNIVAHMALAILLLLLVGRQSRIVTVSGSILLVALILLTASRIAAVMGGLVLIAGLIRMCRSVAARIAVGTLAAGCMLALSNVIPRLSGDALLGGVTENVVSRAEIWRFGWSAMVQHPWTGVGGDFADFFETVWAGPDYGIVHHAHNFWLHFGASYGVVGLLSAIALTVGLIGLALASRSKAAVLALLTIFVANLVDPSLITTGVLIPVSMIAHAARWKTRQV